MGKRRKEKGGEERRGRRREVECNLLLFYILIEASLIPTILLIILWGNQPERKTARFYIIIYTVTASLPILIKILKLITINYHHLFSPTLTTGVKRAFVRRGFCPAIPVC